MSNSEATTRCEQRAMGAEMDTFTGKFPWTGRERSAGDGRDPCARDEGEVKANGEE